MTTLVVGTMAGFVMGWCVATLRARRAVAKVMNQIREEQGLALMQTVKNRVTVTGTLPRGNG